MSDAMHDPSIEEKLRELSSFDTCSSFTRAFYCYITEVLDEGLPASTVRVLYAEHLELTLRYHRRMALIGDREDVSLSDLQSLADKRRISLEHILETAAGMHPDGDADRAGLYLVQAECCFHLRRIAEVIAFLERAMSLGARDPLVCFALGYNRYALALDAFLRPGDQPGEFVTYDVEAYQAACLDAVSAFEQGLRDGEMDAQLYWWIAHVLDSAGLPEAAQTARAQIDKAADAPELTPAEELAERTTAAHDLPPITEEEVRAAAELLKHSFSVEEIQGAD
jgi:hypothetical protein